MKTFFSKVLKYCFLKKINSIKELFNKNMKNEFLKFYVRLKYGLHLNKPVYLIKLFKNLFEARFYRLFGIKKYILRGIDFALTYDCNFNCEHCYAEKLKNDGTIRAMNLDDYKRVAKESMNLGVITFSFQGGEIFLNKDWAEIIKVFKSNINHIVITTNGSFFTEKIVKTLSEIGVDTVQVSIDSGIPEEHDMFRNHKGSFEKIMKGIELLKINKIKIVINTTITHQSLYSEGFKKILEYSNENKILLETIFARPLGHWGGNFDIMLTEEDIRYYYKLRKNYPYIVRDFEASYGGFGCPAVKEVLYITPYGDVCGCPYNHISMGNIFEEPLKQIRKRGLKSKWYNNFYKNACLTAQNREFLNKYLPLFKKVGKTKLPHINDLED
ncbi:MAG: hypothetical protein A2474_03965 [Elusimicrobia bacterium RIFOXYC2_FULL_34_12]|nr:MAG: hypothetical protein A2474_03965 [Elusimicrobia bacterium RIFOXYC2_FULL_34_12]OGS38451.1 MAG: hypothetical protein A2551_06540 [Elusimicrobia bacterium RIFOXYD2_FULL_34_30]HAM38256.1 hypothetical protein [Elusimicrobiota bacterium]